MAYFTPEEANRYVPWLREQFENMGPLLQEREEIKEALKRLGRRSHGNGTVALEKEGYQQQQALWGVSRRLERVLGEIKGKGIILRDVQKGLVDFPALSEGRQVYLCWLKEEPGIAFWHEVDAGFASRRPL